MKIPSPEEGLIINYSYLWKHEADAGLEEGRKDRPCVVLAVTKDKRVYVSPITHTPPQGSTALEIPAQVKRGTKLDDGERSWLITEQYNSFIWPGMDMRAINPRKSDEVTYGRLPRGYMKKAKQEVQQNARGRHVNRDVEQPQRQDKSRTQTPAKAKPQTDPAKTKAPDKSKADLFKQARAKGKDNPKNKGRGR